MPDGSRPGVAPARVAGTPWIASGAGGAGHVAIFGSAAGPGMRETTRPDHLSAVAPDEGITHAITYVM